MQPSPEVWLFFGEFGYFLKWVWWQFFSVWRPWYAVLNSQFCNNYNVAAVWAPVSNKFLTYHTLSIILRLRVKE